jgi:hypothetical protein
MNTFKNIGAEALFSPSQKCEDGRFNDSVFWSINSDDANLYTATNITGYYTRMIESYIKSFDGMENVSVVPALNKELEEDFSDPVIVVQRGNMQMLNAGIMNKGRLPEIPSVDQNAFDDTFPTANYHESLMYSDMIDMQMSITIYGYTHAETERISILLYNLLFAASYDALSYTFDFITGISPPSVSAVSVSEKHSEVYTSNISWIITYVDDAILLIRKNVIKYVTIMLQESKEERKDSSNLSE